DQGDPVEPRGRLRPGGDRCHPAMALSARPIQRPAGGGARPHPHPLRAAELTPRGSQGNHMNVAGADRSRRLVTAGAGTALALVMGLALLAGFRLATQIRSSITALQTASELQTFPGVLAQQLTALRERLETREYTGQAHAELAGTVDRFNA